MPIDAQKNYYLNAVVKAGWLGSTSPFICRRIVMEYGHILKPQFIGSGRATRIIIKGDRINTFRLVVNK